MSGPVFRQALRQVARALLLVSIGAGAFFYLVLLSSSLFLEDVTQGSGQVPEFFRTPPRAVEAFLGGSADFFSPRGWLSAAFLHPVVLALQTAGAIMVSAGAVAAELERGSLDLVLARPVGRGGFLSAKAAAALVAVTGVHLGALAGVLVARGTVERVDEIPLGDVAVAFAGSWALFAAFAMLALFLSARSSLRARATGGAVGIVVGSFFLNFMALLLDQIEGVRYASPFHYFRPADILSGEPYAFDVGVLLVVAAAASAGAMWWFGRRDLTR
jgi:ABC-2 type transport system permease protein